MELTVDFVGSVQLREDDLSLVDPTHTSPTSFRLVAVINVMRTNMQYMLVLFVIYYNYKFTKWSSLPFNSQNRKRQFPKWYLDNIESKVNWQDLMKVILHSLREAS